MKTNQFFTFILFAFAFLLGTSVQAGRQTRQVSGFHGVSVSSGIDLYLTQKDVEEVVVEADSDEMEKIITEVEAGVLKIYIKQKSWLNTNWDSDPRKVYVSFKTLDSGGDISYSGNPSQKNINESSGGDVSGK